jgi:hypothetical protein
MGFFFTGDRGFESTSLQQRVCLSRDFIFLSRDFIFLGKNPGFPRGFPGCVPRRGRQRAVGTPTARQPAAISLSGHGLVG